MIDLRKSELQIILAIETEAIKSLLKLESSLEQISKNYLNRLSSIDKRLDRLEAKMLRLK